jgi:hypothetical protein
VGVDVGLRGEGCLFLLRIQGYQYPEIESGSDANWLTSEIELTAGNYGDYRATQRCSLWAPDLAAFASELGVLYHDLSGQAELRHLEDEIGATVTLRSGKGTLAVHVQEHFGAKLSFADAAIDQTYVREMQEQLDLLLAAFPVR